MKVPNALSRDETEHGVYYYLASEVDAEIERLETEVTRLNDLCKEYRENGDRLMRVADEYKAEIERLKAEREMLTIGRLTVGPYTLRKTTSSGYWLQHESGEGMGIQAKDVEYAIDLLWKDF